MRKRKDDLANVKTVYGGLVQVTTATPATITGATFQRIVDGVEFGSIKLVTAYKFQSTDTETLTLKVEIQDSANGSTWNTANTLETKVITGDGNTLTDTIEHDVDVHGLDIYVRGVITVTQSTTDTSDVISVYNVAGATENFITKSPDFYTNL